MKTFGFASASLVAFSLAAACGDTAAIPISAGGEDGGETSDGGPVGTTKDASSGGDAAADGSVPAKSDPLLAVASSIGLLVWKHAGAITNDVAPDATLVPTSSASPALSAVAASSDRLYASTAAASAALLRFDGARALTTGSTPAVEIAVPRRYFSLAVDATDRLFGVEALGAVSLWPGASKLSTASAPSATFVHVYSQLASSAHDPVADRLFAGQISGGGVVAYDKASTRSGAVANDFAVSSGAYWTMQIASDRLYAAGSHDATTAGVAIWSTASQIASPRAPVLVKTGYERQFISHLVVRHDVLVVAARDQGTVFVYRGASKIDGDRAADFTLTKAAVPGMSRPSRLAMDDNGRLYVTDDDGILVFDGADSPAGPVFVTKVKTGVGAPADLAVLD